MILVEETQHPTGRPMHKTGPMQKVLFLLQEDDWKNSQPFKNNSLYKCLHASMVYMHVCVCLCVYDSWKLAIITRFC